MYSNIPQIIHTDMEIWHSKLSVRNQIFKNKKFDSIIDTLDGVSSVGLYTWNSELLTNKYFVKKMRKRQYFGWIKAV